MPDTTINIEFPEYKLQAIEQALRDKGEQKTVPDFLKEHVESLYTTRVPVQARRYLDAMLGDPNQAQAPPEPERETSPSRRGRPRRAPETEQRPEVISDSPVQEEPEQTMEMTMNL